MENNIDMSVVSKNMNFQFFQFSSIYFANTKIHKKYKLQI